MKDALGKLTAHPILFSGFIKTENCAANIIEYKRATGES